LIDYPNRKDAKLMLPYLITSTSILTLGLFYEAANSGNGLNGKKLPSYFFTIPSFLILFIMSAFRGGFNTDYRNYSVLFQRYNRHDFFDVFSADFVQEPGYLFLSR